jgi:CotH kinase protein
MMGTAPVKKTITIAAATIAGLLALAAAVVLILEWRSSEAAAAAERPDASFRLSDQRDLAEFTSNIPVIVLRADRGGSVSTSKTYSPFTMEIYEPRPNGPARLADGPTSTMRTGVRLRGMVSRQFPKLSYRLKLQDAKGATAARPLLGMPADADWALQGPWLDKSLIRNAFSYDLARAMGAAGMRTRACEVFVSTSGRPLRDADYVGVYQLTEDIERGDDRVKLASLGPDDNTEPAITGGYLLAWDVGDGTFLPRWRSIQVKYPKEPSAAQMAWIDRAFTQFDQALKGPDSRDPLKGYAAHIEVDDWVNYILFEELVFNLDAYVRSFYLQKDRGRKIRPGPVWDHDLGLGHQFRDGTSFTQWWFVGRNAPHGWMPRLMDDPAFRKKAAQRWSELRKGVLRNEQIDARIDTFAAPLLTGAAERNFARWNVLNVERPFTMGGYITIATVTYPEQIAALKKFLRARAAWMDQQLAVSPS